MAFLKEIEKTDHLIRHHHAAHQPDEPILSVSNLTVQYESGPALQDVSFALRRAVRVALLGPNGAGKSTLLKVIAGVISPTQGKVEVFGEKPDEHICIAYVPQRSQVDWNFPIRVRDVVMMGRIGKLGLLHWPKSSDRQIVNQALEEVNLLDLADRQIGELSGGQQQRMFIARALAQEAEIMLMDEPLTGLDVNAQEDILNILNRLREHRVTVMVALHDLEMAAEHFETVMLLNHHLIGLGNTAEVFTKEHLNEAYGGHRLQHLQKKENPWLAIDDTCCGDEEQKHA